MQEFGHFCCIFFRYTHVFCIFTTQKAKQMVSNEEKLLKERIRNLLTMKGTNIAKISESESDRVMLGRQINGDNTVVPFSTLHRLLYMFHDISADWLVMGEGPMEKADHVAPRVYTQNNNVHDNAASGDINVGSGSHVAPSLQQVEAMRQRIAELERDKAFLQTTVTALTALNEQRKD